MANRRIILMLLLGIALCALLLWGLRRGTWFLPADNKVKTVLLEHPLDSVDRVTVDRGDARIGLQLQNGRWMMVSPFAAQVDQGAVARLLDVFESTRVKDSLAFLEMRKRELSLKEFGLASSQAHVVLDGPRQRDEFLFGSIAPVGTEIYMRMNQAEQILVVPVSLYKAIPMTADDLRSRKLIHCDRALIRTVEVRTPGRPYIKLSKESGTWCFVQPVPEPASDAKVESLLDVLYEARVSHFIWPTVSNVMDVAETESAFKTRLGLYGLGSDTGVQIQIQENGAALPAKIAFGHPLGLSSEMTYALLQGGNAISAVSNNVVTSFRLSPGELRDTRLFFESPAKVRRFQVYFGDSLFVLTQKNSVWRLETPVADLADQVTARDTVERLLKLNAESIDDDSAGELRKISNEKSLPISHVELFSDQASWRFTITPDDIDGNFLRVTFTNSPTAFRVASSNMPSALISMIGLLGLRDKTMLALPSDSLRRITFKRTDGVAETVERGKSDPLWHLGEAVTGRIVVSRLDALVARLAGLKADRIERLGPLSDEADAYGFRKPWLELIVDVEAEDAMRKTLLVGKDAGFGKRYAMVRGLDVLFVLGKEDLLMLSERLVEPL